MLDLKCLITEVPSCRPLPIPHRPHMGQKPRFPPSPPPTVAEVWSSELPAQAEAPRPATHQATKARSPETSLLGPGGFYNIWGALRTKQL